MNPVRNTYLIKNQQKMMREDNSKISNGMKILVFSPYYPPHIGELESHADEFNKHLVECDRSTKITIAFKMKDEK
jgi:hypothetical protein